MKTYWVLAKKLTKGSAYLPSYEILETEPPEGKKEALPPGHCLDLFKCSLSKDETYITCDLYCVTNDNGHIIEQHTETFYLQRS